MPLSRHEVDIASGVTYGASGVALAVGTMTIQDWASIAAIIGVMATVGGNWYWKRKYYKLIKKRAEDGKEDTDSWLSR